MPRRKRAKSSASTSSGSTTVALARDEQKQAQDRAKKREDLVGNVDALLGAILEEPTILRSDDLKGLRDFVAEVSNHPTVFPPDVAVPMSSHGSEIDLSSGFVENVYRRKGGSSKDLSLKELPVLPVTHVSKAMKESRSGISLKYT